jgi:3-deoxy-manno-octulosonate cytidylyltransferase (CMP-KDO synthetase)
VKVIINKYKQALYFSRSPVPYCRNFPDQEWLKQNIYYKHIGIYGYRTAVLREIAALPKTKLEITESLEQLRWPESGYVINTEITTSESIAVDTPEDLLRIKNAP